MYWNVLNVCFYFELFCETTCNRMLPWCSWIMSKKTNICIRIDFNQCGHSGLLSPEAVARECSVKSSKFVAQVFSIEFCEISKNTFSNGTPPVAASVPQNVLTFDVVERRICFTHSWKSKWINKLRSEYFPFLWMEFYWQSKTCEI